MHQSLELLSPAGDSERLETAVRYGADAVYLGGLLFGMRATAASFGPQALGEAVAFAHGHGARVYLTCNTLPTNAEIAELPDFLQAAAQAGVDALIIADVGVLQLARRVVPSMRLHVSTQAGVVNYLTATELYQMGASRVVLARELSIEEIRCIRENTPPALELEVFAHGAMCMSFSGRCLLSQYLNGRDANRGECSQPCRWKYHLVEEKRPGQYFPIFEDEQGSYILNAQDLCMIESIDRLAEAGITSLKIEGRAKSLYYVAAITGAYRAAIDAWQKNPADYQPPAWALEEVRKVSHRDYSTGFFFGRPEQLTESDDGYVRRWDVIATVEGYRDGALVVCERNRFFRGEQAEIMAPGRAPVPFFIETIIDPEEGACETACHPMRLYLLPYPEPLPAGAMIRRQKPLND